MFENCPIDYTLNLISGKWKMLILRSLTQGAVRYGVLLKELDGISPKVLTQQLREMENDGLVERIAYPEVPPRVEYSLTPKGQDLQPIMYALSMYGLKNNPLCGQHCEICTRCHKKAN